MVGGIDFSDKLCAVIVDKVELMNMFYIVNYTVQRGFIRYSVRSVTDKFNKGIALVKYKDIKEVFDRSVEFIYESLESSLIGDSDSLNIELIKEPVSLGYKDSGRFGFVSLGFSSVNNLCYLIDLYAMHPDTKGRALYTDIAINILSNMDSGKLSVVKSALKARYNGTSNKLYIVLSHFFRG